MKKLPFHQKLFPGIQLATRAHLLVNIFRGSLHIRQTVKKITSIRILWISFCGISMDVSSEYKGVVPKAHEASLSLKYIIRL